VLDLACGTALQLRALAKSNYQATGLDYSQKMIDYLKEQAVIEGLKIEVIAADMNNFKLKEQKDFAYIMMGSIIYTKNNELFLSHLNSVANSLKSGGLYLIENMSFNWSSPKFLKPQTWTMKKKGIKVKTTYQITPKDALKQIVTQTIKIEVDDHGTISSFVDKDDLKLIFPEELKLLLENNNRFEFIGFFERNQVKELKKLSSDNIVLLRKK
jgi:SAM-dependent methyltransferase